MATVLLRAVGIWVLLVVVGILNGAMREKILVPLLGQELALPLSGVLLSVLIFLVTLLLVSFLGVTILSQYWIAGATWVLLTIAFEFTFGHYVMGKSWSELLETFNVLKGNLMLLALITTGISPYLAARLRGFI